VEEDTQSETKPKPSQKNLLIPIVIVVIVLAVGGYLLLSRGGGYRAPTTQPVPAPGTTGVEETVVVPENGDATEEEGAVTEAREIVVEGSEFSFSPSSITVNAGEKVKLTFNNVGNFPHNFTVEGLGVATRTIGAGQSDTIEFTVEESGTLTFFCSVSNHRSLGMEGTLEVE